MQCGQVPDLAGKLLFIQHLAFLGARASYLVERANLRGARKYTRRPEIIARTYPKSGHGVIRTCLATLVSRG